MEMYCTTSYAKTEAFISYIITRRTSILNIWIVCIPTEIHDYRQTRARSFGKLLSLLAVEHFKVLNDLNEC